MKTPKLSRHKATGQYYSSFRGRFIYFGKDFKEAKRLHRLAVAHYLRTGEPPARGGAPERTPAEDIALAEVILAYWQHAQDYYGPESKETGVIKSVLRRLREHMGAIAAQDLGPKLLRGFMEALADAGHTRYAVNRHRAIVIRMYRWAVAEELVPAAVAEALRAVPGFRKGRTAAPEPAPGRVPSEAEIFRVAEHMPGSLGDALRLQYFTGARPGEVLGVCPRDVDREGTVWKIRLAQHKTAHHGHSRILYVGPQGQSILRPYLMREADRPVFRPQDALEARSARSETHRRPGQAATPRKTDRTIGEAYDVTAYRKAVRRACKAASVEPFTPHKVRHAAAARFRGQFGLDVTQKLLGHRHAAVSEIYARADEGMAMDAISQVG